MNFAPKPPALLKDGTNRNDYIRGRLLEGATVKQVVDEINAPERYGGTEGSMWEPQVVYVIRRKLRDEGLLDANAAPAEEPEPEPPVEIKTGMDALSDEDIAEIRAQALAQLQEAERKKAKADFLKKETERLKLRAGLDPKSGEEMREIYIDLPDFAAYIQFDMPMGPAYFHGTTHQVPLSRYRSLQEQMHRMWQHQAEIDGKSSAYYTSRRVTKNVTVGAGGNVSRMSAPGVAA